MGNEREHMQPLTPKWGFESPMGIGRELPD